MDIVSNAPMPSMETMVRWGICSVAAPNACATESVPARVEKASLFQYLFFEYNLKRIKRETKIAHAEQEPW